jgi:hypothetical protein
MFVMLVKKEAVQQVTRSVRRLKFSAKRLRCEQQSDMVIAPEAYENHI